MTARHLISLRDLDDDALRWLVDRGVWYAGGGVARPLAGATIGIHEPLREFKQAHCPCGPFRQ